jgi:Protein of unknown function (DUF998)
MRATISVSNGFLQNISLKKIFLAGGIVSSLLYVAMNIFIAMQYPGYNSATYTVSELSAVGAPTRSLWTGWAFAYTFLVTAFGWAILKSAGQNRAVRIMGVLILIYGALGIGWHFAPMHQREVLAAGGGTLSDTMHLVLSFASVLLMLMAIGLGAAAFDETFRFYSIISLVILLVFGTLTGLEAPKVESNQPTPLIGVWERINIGIFLLWVVVLAILLLRRKEIDTKV